MRALINPHIFSGTVTIPASKSHTVRRLLLASLTEGTSRIELPLDSLDAQSCAAACRIMGAELTEERDDAGRLIGWIVRGRKPAELSGVTKIPNAAEISGGAVNGGNIHDGAIIDVGNSGTTLFLAIAAAALGSAPFTFTGDDQIARRSAAPLLDALAGLGVSVTSSRSPDGKPGCTPITVCGPWKGGRVSVSCPTSQYLSALLIAAPLAPANTVTEIDVPLLNEKPYVEMTLSYLKAQGLFGGNVNNGAESSAIHSDGFPISAAADFSHFRIRGGCAYTPINGPVPGDFSSAAFPAAAAAISKGTITLLGLDPNDTQGDKIFFEYLKQMGCEVRWGRENAPRENAPDKNNTVNGDDETAGWRLTVSRSGPLRGGVFDLNATPDLLPVMAALGAFAGEPTSLVNAAHARIKETDRIAVMASELRKLFAGTSFRCEEKPDGLLIQGSGSELPIGDVSSAGKNSAGLSVQLDGHDDHRVVMALACAALGVANPVEIASAEAADVTYPGFLELVHGLTRINAEEERKGCGLP